MLEVVAVAGCEMRVLVGSQQLQLLLRLPIDWVGLKEVIRVDCVGLKPKEVAFAEGSSER